MLEVLGHSEDYYTEEYQKTWRNDLRLLERMTKDLGKKEMQRIYDMINGETWEFMDMTRYLINENINQNNIDIIGN